MRLTHAHQVPNLVSHLMEQYYRGYWARLSGILAIEGLTVYDGHLDIDEY